jgi:hypothetical protein
VLNDALDVVSGVFVSGFAEAGVPAAETGVALTIALIKDHDATSVIDAGFFLRLAVLLDTLLRSIQ